jgi:amino acid adenylation domain-containing protein
MAVPVLALAGEALARGEVSTADEASKQTRRVVGCGVPFDEMRLLVVDPHSLQPSDPGRVGELWVQGSSVGQGYWQREQMSREIFGALTAGGEGPYLRTGDLGFIRDGQLFVTGRLKDLVIVLGRNYAPQDIEWSVQQSDPTLRAGYGAAFSIPGDDGEVLVVVQEVERGVDSADLDGLIRGIRRAVADEHELLVHAVVLIQSGTVPRTTSGKIRRQSCRQAYLDGSLQVLHVDVAAVSVSNSDVAPAMTPENRPDRPVERVLREIWREVLQTDQFDIHDSFLALGGHSLLATQVLSRVHERFGVELPLHTLFETRTLAGLASAIESMHGGLDGTATPHIPQLKRDGLLPSSFSQRRMWLIQQLHPETAAYNIAFAVRLRGALDRGALGAALQLLIERHEAFRTTLVAQDGEPMQRIVGALSAPLEFIDLRELPAAARSDAARELLRLRSLVPYRLSHGPLHRMLLLRIDAECHVFYWCIHHAVSDGWSAVLLMRELALIYPALRRGEQPPLEPKAMDFADYAAWQREALRGSALERQLQFWRDAVAGLEPLPLPTDRPRRQMHDGRGKRISATIAPATLSGIKALAVEHSITPFMALLACFQVLLARYCGVTDIAVATPIANRTQRASEQLVGALVNTVVMRTELGGNPSFSELLQRVRATALAAYEHQDLPFEALVEALALPRSGGEAPLAQVLFNVLNPPGSALRMDGVGIEWFEFDSGTSQFDLGLSIDTELFGEAQLSFSTALFDDASGDRLLSSYLGLLDQVVAAPHTALLSLKLLDDATQRTLAAWATSAVRLPQQSIPHVHGLIDAQAERTPQRLALRSSSGSLKYAELATRSNQLARLLRTRGIGRGALVGLCVERSLDMVVAQLAVLKSGAAYVPLDPAYPTDRIAHMCTDAQLALLIAESEVRTPFWPADKTLMLDLDRAEIAAQDTAPPTPDDALDAGAADPAYVIYTSGSTGKPKGVVVPHWAVVNFLRSMAQQPGLSADDAIAAVTTLSFDIAVLELLLPLTLGAQVVLASREEATSGKLLRRLLEKRAATVMQATPSTWRMLIDAGWVGSPTFKALIGGEALPIDLAEQLLSRTGELWNMYGPTETTVWSTCWRVGPGVAISIGAPIANTQVHVLDPLGQACPIGVAGEIFIGGDGVALGYLNRPELTAERFVADPFRTAPGARLYRTGDRGRWRNDGLLEHLGRLDHQVKVRGHRIELGEIEATYALHPSVAQAVVIVREDRPGDVRLVAYLIARAGTITPTREALRDHLRATLPDYMLPQHAVWLEMLPLLPNGKLDRQTLPMPAEPTTEHVDAPEPMSPLERAIADVWQELLGIGQVGLRDNFFDLGGHSLLAMRAVAAIEARTGLRLDARRLVFESLAQLGVAVDEPAETQY